MFRYRLPELSLEAIKGAWANCSGNERQQNRKIRSMKKDIIRCDRVIGRLIITIRIFKHLVLVQYQRGPADLEVTQHQGSGTHQLHPWKLKSAGLQLD